MPTKAGCRRRQRRFSISETGGGAVEFEYPEPGCRRHCVPLTDISASGLSFNMDEPLPGLESGASINQVLIRLGDCEIRGDLLLMHVTPIFLSTLQCGALFYPATDTDLIKLKSVLAGIGAVQSR